MVQMLLDYLFYQIVLLKKMYNGQEGIISSFKFIQKLWNLHLKILKEIQNNHKEDTSDELVDIPINLLKILPIISKTLVTIKL